MTNETEKNQGKKTLTLKKNPADIRSNKSSVDGQARREVLVVTKKRKLVRTINKGDEEAGNSAAKPINSSTKSRSDRTLDRNSDRTTPSRGQSRNMRTTSSPASQSNSRELSSVEMEARAAALKQAKIQAELDAIKKQEELKLQAELALQQEEERKKKAILDKEREAELAKQISLGEVEEKEIQPAPAKEIKQAKEAKFQSQEDSDYEKSETEREKKFTPSSAAKPSRSEIKDLDVPKGKARPAKSARGVSERRTGKLTVTNALDEDDIRSRSIASMRRRQNKMRRMQTQEVKEKISREVTIPETISLQELAQRMTERCVDVIKYLMKQGQILKPADVIDADTAQLIAEEFGHTVKRVAESDIEEGFFDIEDDESQSEPRPPIVTVMGHVDHGKTSLLDAIRKTNIIAKEAGGITQHIGAYQVIHDGKKITFIDTPGHAAFTAMRARGAQTTDIAILVVAADDSVMPQTIESISHAKAANVPIIVAINKVDKPAANPQKVRTELLQHEVFVESMGGDVLEAEVSAKTGQNIDGLLEAIILQAEVMNLKANRNRIAEGVVIEAEIDKGRGTVATLLVQKGTLKLGDIIVAGSQWGRVRAIINDKGKNQTSAGPSDPVEILGMQGTPLAGDKFAVVNSESKAREIAAYRQRIYKEKQIAKQAGLRGSLEQMMNQMQIADLKEMPLLIKGDVQGSIEAIRTALEKLGNNEIKANIIHSGVGAISQSDILLAEASNAVVLGFNIRANSQAREIAKQHGIEIRYYNIIYDLVDDIKAAMSGMLTPERRETFLGNAEIAQVFYINKVGKVAGCNITEGKIERGASVRLIRDNIVIHEGKLKTLKRFKDEVNEAFAGQECGMAFEKYDDIRAGDVIEAFRLEHIARSL